MINCFQSEEACGDLEEEFDDENEIDDWEDVESTELEKLFGAASTYADAMVAVPGVNPSSEAMLQLHAFYKIATEGPCSTSQPSAFQLTARAKWYNFYAAARILDCLVVLFDHSGSWTWDLELLSFRFRLVMLRITLNNI